MKNIMSIVTKTMVLAAAAATVIGLGACGDETGFGKGFEKEPGDDPNPSELPYPVEPGDTFVFNFRSSYKPNVNDTQGGLTVNETQTTGNLCLKVSSVTNNHNEGTESILTADVKVAGASAGEDVFFSYNGDEDAITASQAETTLGPLWVSKLTVPIRNHGMLTPISKTFRTQASPTPPSQDLTKLPFFDPRLSLDKVWGGWEGDQSVENPQSFVGHVLGYFIEQYGASFLTSDDFHFNFSGSAPGSPHVLLLVWRETLASGPMELQGDVVHTLQFRFTEDGVLYELQEYIVDDLSPSTPVDGSFLTGGCEQSGGCANGLVSLTGEIWSTAKCTF